jgi:hypothetical protein
MESVSKTCSKCGEDKPFSEFPRNKSSKDGYHANCKTCRQAGDKQRYQLKKAPEIQREVQWQNEINVLISQLGAASFEEAQHLCEEILKKKLLLSSKNFVEIPNAESIGDMVVSKLQAYLAMHQKGIFGPDAFVVDTNGVKLPNGITLREDERSQFRNSLQI